MSTTAMPVASESLAETKKAKVPSTNPWLAPNVCCNNKGCGKIITPALEPAAKGGEPQLVYRCWDCRWELEASLVPINGQIHGIGASKRPPEVWEKTNKK